METLLPTSALVLGRLLDLAGTRAASPDLGLETNAWMRRLGWRLTLVGNAAFVAVVLLLAGPSTWIWLGAFSALLGLRKAQLAWVARALGPRDYGTALRRWLREAPLSSVAGAILLEAGIPVLLGAAILDGSALRDHERLWSVADVGRGVLLYGLFAGLLRTVTAWQVRRAPAPSADTAPAARDETRVEPRRERTETEIDRTLEMSFPASDPPPWTP